MAARSPAPEGGQGEQGEAAAAPGVRVTVRDRAMLAWAGRQRFVTPEILAKRVWEIGRFGNSERVAERGEVDPRRIRTRLYRLRSAGLLTNKRYYFEGSSAWTVTAKGLREGGLQLPPSNVDTRTYEHDLSLAALCVELEAEFPEGRVLTEREIRAVDGGRDEPIYSPGSVGGRGLAIKLHYPDLAIEEEPGADPIAVELEIAAKGPRRLNAIMRLYAGATHLKGVRYYVVGERTESSVREAIAYGDVNKYRDFTDVRRIDLPRLF